MNSRIRFLCQIAAVLVGSSAVNGFSAETIRLLAERNTPSAGSDFFLLSYPSLTDMVNGTNLVQQSLAIPLADTFSFGGMTADGSGGFRLLAERNTPSAGSDFFLLSYPSLTDMVNGTNLVQQSLAIPLADTFGFGGFITDGSGGFRLVAERDTPSAGSDFFLLSYPSLTDMVNGTNLVQQSLAIPLADTFSFGGFAADGSGGFRLIAERNTPSAGSDFFLLSYPSLTDMVNGTNLVQQSLAIPLADTFSFGGFTIEVSATPDPESVPEADSVFVPFLAVGALAVFSRLFPRVGLTNRRRR